MREDKLSQTPCTSDSEVYALFGISANRL